MNYPWTNANDLESWLPLDQCKDGYLYHIAARNASIGIFRADRKGFEIRRKKFSRIYRFVEYHWDTGVPYGTVKPIAEIEQAPTFASEPEFIAYMESKDTSSEETR